MNKSTFFYIIFIIGIVLLCTKGVEAAACGATPVEDCTVGSNYQMVSNQIIYLNDTNLNGSIQITADNIIIDCNGSTIIGNNLADAALFKEQSGTYAFRGNFTVKNCNIKNFYYGIYTNVPNNTRIFNNVFTNCTKPLFTDTYDDTRGYNKIYNNTFNNTKDVAISLYYGWWDEIINNTFYNTYNYAIGASHTNYSLIRGNYINNISGGVSQSGIILDYTSTYAVVDNNTVNNSVWNCIDAEASYSNYTNNKVSNCLHGGIDTCAGDIHGYISTTNNKLLYNTITNSYTGFYICSGSYINISYNNISNILRGAGNDSVAFGAEGNHSEVHDNNFNYNNVANVSGVCILAGADNTTSVGNNLNNCTDAEVQIMNWYGDITKITRAIFKNNNYLNGYARFIRDNTGNFSATINETTTNNLTIQIPLNNGANHNALFNYNGKKEFTLSGSNLTIIDQLSQFPYNNIKNVSNNIILASNFNTYSLIMSSNQQIEVGDFNGCIAATENMIINSTHNSICNATYNLNDSDTNGVFTFVANSNLNCNGATFIGAKIPGSILFSSGVDNISIHDCIFSDYDIGLIADYGKKSISFYNNRVYGVFGEGYQKGAIFMESISDSAFYNNNINTSTRCFEGYSWTNVSVYNNNLSCSHSLILLYDDASAANSGLNIYNNTFGKYGEEVSTIKIQAYSLDGGVNIYNNLFIGHKLNDYVLVGMSGNNSKIYNNTIIFNKSIRPENYYFAINLRPETNNASVYNNTIIGIDGISVDGNNNRIFSNYFGNKLNGGFSSLYVAGNNNLIYNNRYIDGCNDLHLSGYNNRVYNETFYNETYIDNEPGPGCMMFIYSRNANNLTIENTTTNLSDIGIEVYNTTGLLIKNVKISNTITGTDHWNTCYHIVHNTSNVLMINASCYNSGINGAIISMSRNVTWKDSDISLVNTTLAQLNTIRQEVFTAGIRIVEVYKTWDADGDNQEPYLNSKVARQQYKSSNITISNLTYSGNMQTYLVTQGATGINVSLPSNWNRTFNPDESLADSYTYYNNINYNNLSFWNTFDNEIQYSELFGWMTNWSVSVSLSKTKIRMTNWHNFDNNDSTKYNVSLYALEAIIPYNDIKNISNGLILASGVDAFSILLAPNQIIEVSNFTLSSNITSSYTYALYQNNLSYTINILDPDHVYNYTSVKLLDDEYNLLVQNDSNLLNISGSFTDLSNGYYYIYYTIYDNLTGTHSSEYVLVLVDTDNTPTDIKGLKTVRNTLYSGLAILGIILLALTAWGIMSLFNGGNVDFTTLALVVMSGGLILMLLFAVYWFVYKAAIGG